MSSKVFEAFNNGRLVLPGKVNSFEQIGWSKHPTFEGVELKHIITGAETGSQLNLLCLQISRPGAAAKQNGLAAAPFRFASPTKVVEVLYYTFLPSPAGTGPKGAIKNKHIPPAGRTCLSSITSIHQSD